MPGWEGRQQLSQVSRCNKNCWEKKLQNWCKVITICFGIYIDRLEKLSARKHLQ